MRSISLYHRHRFPAEIISHCVWLYFRFALSFRDVEEMLAMRGVSVSYETVREWCLKFGQTYANGLRHRSPWPADLNRLITRSRATFSFSVRNHYLTLQSGTTPVQSSWLSGSDEVEIRGMARSNLRRGNSQLTR